MGQLIVNKKRILVADDENLIRSSLGNYFREAGYSVDAVMDGEEAIKKLERFKYDIVVTDLDMPKVNGIELLEKMQSMGIVTPVIIISAYFNQNFQDETYCNYAFKCINKPFQLKDVLHVVQQATG